MTPRSAPHHVADDCVPDETEHMRALGFDAEEFSGSDTFEQKENTMLRSPPKPPQVFKGISYKVELRAAPGRDGDGMLADAVMWSADLATDQYGNGLTASGATPDEALTKLHVLIHEQAETFPSDG